MTMGERSIVRAELDALPDFIVSGKEIKFRKEFRTLASHDPSKALFDSLPADSCYSLIDVFSRFPLLLQDYPLERLSI